MNHRPPVGLCLDSNEYRGATDRVYVRVCIYAFRRKRRRLQRHQCYLSEQPQYSTLSEKFLARVVIVLCVHFNNIHHAHQFAYRHLQVLFFQSSHFKYTLLCINIMHQFTPHCYQRRFWYLHKHDIRRVAVKNSVSAKKSI